MSREKNTGTSHRLQRFSTESLVKEKRGDTESLTKRTSLTSRGKQEGAKGSGRSPSTDAREPAQLEKKRKS